MLINKYPTCQHVENMGLSVSAKDQDIWKWAKAKDYMIVTNDEDFLRVVLVLTFSLPGTKFLLFIASSEVALQKTSESKKQQKICCS